MSDEELENLENCPNCDSIHWIYVNTESAVGFMCNECNFPIVLKNKEIE